MPSATTTEQLLFAWGVWSRIDADAGPADAGCGSAESAFRSPQCWDETKRPRVVLIDDQTAMRVERAVLGTGVVLAAALRTFYVRQHPPRRHAEVQLLLEAQRRVGALLEGSQEARNRRRSDADDGRAMSGSTGSV